MINGDAIGTKSVSVQGHSEFYIFHSTFFILFRAGRAFALHHDRVTGCARRSPTEEGEVGCSAIAALRCAASHRAAGSARASQPPRSVRCSPSAAAGCRFAPSRGQPTMFKDRRKHDGPAELSITAGSYLGSDDERSGTDHRSAPEGG
jgi:hypothetical protein